MKYEQARTSMDASMQDSVDLSYADTFLADESYEADAGIRKAERKQLVSILMNQLTAQQRKVVHLYYWQNYTQAEIGGLLQITRRRVGQVMDEAIRVMRDYAHEHHLSPW